jgi:Arc/MetJ-type ribon-helix-helix transcriptional regulator
MPAMHAPKYDSGMTTKITVSLPDEAVAAAKRAVKEGRAASVSAYVAGALEQTYGNRRPLADLVAEMITEHGEPSAEDYEWARKALGVG